MQSKRQTIAIWLGIFLLTTTTALAAGQPAPAGNAKPWVVAHTNGQISSGEVIKVAFFRKIVTPERVGVNLTQSPIAFSPAIAGVAKWTKAHILEFKPSAPLPGGQTYTATIQPLESGTGQTPFSFEFEVLRQAFEVTIEGLKAVRQKDTEQLRLTGVITTADIADSNDVIRLLKARQSERALTVRFTHAKDRRTHWFVAGGIKRGTIPSVVQVTWNGTPIGATGAGRQTIAVPAAGPFSILKARAIQGREQFVEIRFSDPLLKNQNLNGLIRLERRRNLKYAIDGSIVRVYSPARLLGEVKIRLEAGIKNNLGYRLAQPRMLKVEFADTLPKVRFAGKGVILPTTQGLKIPIETLNLWAVSVEVLKIYSDNIPQFLQINALDGNNQLRRVGRVVWKKVVKLKNDPEHQNRWQKHLLDVAPLIENHAGGLYRIKLSFRRPHVVYPCEGQSADPALPESPPASEDETVQDSYWNAYEQDGEYDYDERFNPCHPSFYRDYYDHTITVARNVLVSDIGLIAKRAPDGTVFVAATDLKSTRALGGTEITVLDFQQQVLGRKTTDDQGTALFQTDRKPFLVVARHGQQSGYLKLDDGSANAVSHFDVAGQTIKKGLKGFIYGERGVWRPGDPIFLTFILFDPDQKFPAQHPVLLELRNPRGQVAKILQQKESLNGFYGFRTATTADAPTGNWTALIKAGGARFEKTLKIETVVPNRLKLNLDFGETVTSLKKGDLQGLLSATWLHGATAKNLAADIKLTFTSGFTRFARFAEYVFDDPLRAYQPESDLIFDGHLDGQGAVRFKTEIAPERVSPGVLTANFITRVFEPGGAFSVDRFRMPYHPFERYIGIRVPKGDKARGMLLTDTVHTVRIAALDPDGKPVPKARVEVKLYKIKWRWWWQKEKEYLADYVGSDSYRPLQTATLDVIDGEAQWPLEIKYPSWGRYLISARDLDGNHRTGRIVYIDWPGWAGRAQKDTPGGATVLSFAADKEQYTVGEKVVLTIPTAQKGRGLVSIESGRKIVHTAWFEATEGQATRYEFTTTPEMAPNVYAHVTFIQPHLQTANDLPIRMYGLTRIKVSDPRTHLTPVIETPPTFVPEESATVMVTEKNNREMTYTLAIVDEGLLDLTRFKTPNPWAHFYRQEALGVKTWDLFDMVAGAYGGTFQRLLAIGGDEAAAKKQTDKANRFPPMVRFYGPFQLAAGNSNNHAVDIPQYVGSVRVMVVAGQAGAFGAAHKAVFVRKPLMVLATLPRVLGPGESVDMPVSVFAMEKEVQAVSLTVTADGPLTVAGPEEQSIVFSEPGDELVNFKLNTEEFSGIAEIDVAARSGDATAGQKIEIDVRLPTEPVINVVRGVVQPAADWQAEVALTGMAGTNSAMLEVGRIPPLNLAQRLRYLLRYPHGCAEQSTSAVFPQLFLDRLIELSPGRLQRLEKNVKAGIERLQRFQRTDGGFAYWPGANRPDDWISSYAGHFLLEATRVGYLVAPGVMTAWQKFQRRTARDWEGGGRQSDLKQAYRLFTLALAGQAELGAMNRLREQTGLSLTARYRLAAAYQLAGQPEAARQLIQGLEFAVSAYTEMANTYGSDLRDMAMALETLTLMNQRQRSLTLVEEISSRLGSDQWLSTQTTAYALMAVARHAGLITESSQSSESPKELVVTYTWNGKTDTVRSGRHPLVQIPLPVTGSDPDAHRSITLQNKGPMVAYTRVISEGTPMPGHETEAQNGLSLQVEYFTSDPEPINITAEIEKGRIEQGTDFVAQVTVKHTGKHTGRSAARNPRLIRPYREVALTQMIPSGWEIHNQRLDQASPGGRKSYNYRDIRDDRIFTYFDLQAGETKVFRTLLNASYRGRFYLPMIMAEAMYDATVNARVPGRWIEVVQPGQQE